MTGRRRAALAAAVLGLAGLGLTACGASPPAPAGFAGHGSIEEAYVTGAPPGTRLAVVDGAGRRVGSGTVDRLGSLIVRNLTPGDGYRFEETAGGTTRATAPFAVLSTHSAPPASFYSAQHLHAGLNYLKMRDGVLLAATVRLPPGKTLADGPFPTVIEYSGYAVAAPHSLVAALTGGASTDDPLLPDTATVVGSAVAPLLGFVTVSLQMRGTGCSGGAFDLFGYPSDYDGYDAVQIVGSQPWVLHHKVGMVGISFSGISQLEVAGTDPPDLAAITPLSPTDDLFSTGYPGGIYNDGFAKSWIAQRESDAQPAPGGGQPWAKAEIAAGDRTCLANQRLHLQAQQLADLVGPGLQRDPALFDRRSPSVWAAHITVPVFLAGSLEDEEVGPQWPALVDALAKDPDVYVTMTNGTHIDSLDPQIISRWLEFLDIYVAGRVPQPAPLLTALGPALYASVTGGAPAAAVPAVRFTTDATPAQARADFAAHDPRVRVLFDNGGGTLGPGALQTTAEAGYDAWPPAGTVTRLALGPGGTLSAAAPAASSQVSFTPNPAARPAVDLPSGNAWAAQPPYDWTTVPAADGLGFATGPLPAAVTVVGPASLDLWLSSSAPVTDLQVTVTDVDPATGRESYVTSGFLRSSYRTELPGSSALAPRPDFTAAAARRLPAGQATVVRIPVDPIAHVFPAGDRIRIVVSAPGGDRPSWSFDTPATGGRVTDTVDLGGTRPSMFVVDEVAPVAAGTPACGALRGEPCRPYQPQRNGG